MKYFLNLAIVICAAITGQCQRMMQGVVLNANNNEPIAGATVQVKDSSYSVVCDDEGKFSIQLRAGIILEISAIGYTKQFFTPGNQKQVSVFMVSAEKEIDAVVVSGTLKPVRKSDSPVAVEV